MHETISEAGQIWKESLAITSEERDIVVMTYTKSSEV